MGSMASSEGFRRLGEHSAYICVYIYIYIKGYSSAHRDMRRPTLWLGLWFRV